MAGSLPGKLATIVRSEGALSETIGGRVGGLELSLDSWLKSGPTLPANCCDYIFTDPPYVFKVQYGELNFVWESWLGFDTAWLQDEIIVNPLRHKTLAVWEADLRLALVAAFRVLKPGRWLSLCYHDTDAGTWSLVQDALRDVGFDIHSVTVLDPKQKSNNQNTGREGGQV